jgi:hypothetical protein
MMNSIHELELRCAAAGLSIEFVEPEEEGASGFFAITDPKAEWKWSLCFAGNPLDEEILLNSRFESYRPLSGYDATWSRSDGRIECELVWESGLFLQDGPFDELCVKLGLGRDAAAQASLSVPVPTGVGQPRVSIGWSSHEHRVWRCASPAVHVWSSQERVPVVVIEGVKIEGDLEARKLLESYGVAALLELERCFGFAARLRGHYPWNLWIVVGNQKPRPSLRELRGAPEIEPVSLYWQGRGAGNLPAQFIGFYQVLEFYFSRCARKAFEEKLCTKLEVAGLGKADAGTLKSLDGAAKRRGRPLVSEEEQLACTLNVIVDGARLREFIEGDVYLNRHYRGTEQGIVKTRIPAEDGVLDLRRVTARRLYEIRCRLVHTKEGGRKGSPVFLPLSAEAAALRHDVVLIRFLARQALDVMSMPLSSK